MNRKTLTTLAVATIALLAAGAISAQTPGKNLRHAPPGAAMSLPDFATLDADGDGRITPEEVDAWRATRLQAFDPDGDGVITREEMKASFVAAAQARAEAMADRMFDRLDVDKDGRITAAEALAARNRRGIASADLIKRFDRDGDGAISKEEYDRAASRMQRRGEAAGSRAPRDRRGAERGNRWGGTHHATSHRSGKHHAGKPCGDRNRNWQTRPERRERAPQPAPEN